MAKRKTKGMARKPVAKKTAVKKRKNSLALAVISLILNIIILPGLGTLIGGKIRVGIWQVLLLVVGALLSLIWIGIPLVLAVWIWGIVSGIQLIQESRA